MTYYDIIIQYVGIVAGILQGCRSDCERRAAPVRCAGLRGGPGAALAGELRAGTGRELWAGGGGRGSAGGSRGKGGEGAALARRGHAPLRAGCVRDGLCKAGTRLRQRRSQPRGRARSTATAIPIPISICTSTVILHRCLCLYLCI